MTEMQFVNWAILAAFGIAGFFMKRTIDSVEKRLEDMKKENIHIRQNYLLKEDFREFKTELRGMFEEIKTDIKSLQRKQ